MKRVVLFTGLFGWSMLFADPTSVIKYFGSGQPIQPYLKDIQASKKSVNVFHDHRRVQFEPETSSKRLSPGIVKPRSINLKEILHPIYIVGTDKNSIKWLKQYRSRLEAIHAIGVVVNAPNYKAYEKVRGIAMGPLLPLNADSLARRFQLHHYPVLITKKRIEQ